MTMENEAGRHLTAVRPSGPPQNEILWGEEEPPIRRSFSRQGKRAKRASDDDVAYIGYVDSTYHSLTVRLKGLDTTYGGATRYAYWHYRVAGSGDAWTNACANGAQEIANGASQSRAFVIDGLQESTLYEVKCEIRNFQSGSAAVSATITSDRNGNSFARSTGSFSYDSSETHIAFITSSHNYIMVQLRGLDAAYDASYYYAIWYFSTSNSSNISDWSWGGDQDLILGSTNSTAYKIENLASDTSYYVKCVIKNDRHDSCEVNFAVGPITASTTQSPYDLSLTGFSITQAANTWLFNWTANDANRVAIDVFEDEGRTARVASLEMDSGDLTKSTYLKVPLDENDYLEGLQYARAYYYRIYMERLSSGGQILDQAIYEGRDCTAPCAPWVWDRTVVNGIISAEWDLGSSTTVGRTYINLYDSTGNTCLQRRIFYSEDLSGTVRFDAVEPGVYMIKAQSVWNGLTCRDLAGEEDKFTCGVVVPAYSKIAEWSWEKSNGNATKAETQQAFSAIMNHGKTTSFSIAVWNDLVEKVRQAYTYANAGQLISVYEAKLDAARMTAADKVLTAARFNNVRFVIGSTLAAFGSGDTKLYEHYVNTGSWDMQPGEVLLGAYINELTVRLNQGIGQL